MMRVLHLCWSYPSALFPAEGSFFRNMVEPLLDAGVEATVVTPVPYVPRFLGKLIPRLRRAAVLPRSYEFGGVQVLVPRHIRLPHALIRGHLPVMLASTVASAVHQKPDILHAHFAYPYGVAAVRLRRQWCVPLVLTIHGSDAYAAPYQSEAGRRCFIQAVRGADRVLAVSNDLVRRTHELTGRTVQFWPIGIDLDCFRWRPDDKGLLRRQLGLPPDKKLLLFVGSLTKSKGADQIPALMDRLHPDVQAVLVGDGPLRGQVCSSPRCTWVPRMPNSRVADYLSAADVMVLPTENEGTPTVLVEAGAVHLPVVANAVGGIPDLLGDDRGVLAECQNMASLVGAVQATLADPKASALRAERLSAYVARYYDCRRNGRGLKQLYAQVAARTALGEASAPRASVD